MRVMPCPASWPRCASAGLLACALACMALAGCAGSALFSGFGGTTPLFANSHLTALQARELIVPGKTTQAEVLALLGSATIINFDSGQAVWVYRTTPARSANPGAEFVILFDRAKVVQKTRIRAADASP